MAKKLGNNYRLRISDMGGTPTWTEIAGQQDLSISRSNAAVDTSTKDDWPYGTQAPGLRTASISFNLIPDLPDANGYGALETAATATDPVDYQIVDTANSNAVVWEASMYVGDFNTSFGQNDAVKATGTLTLAAAPTTDALS